MPNYKKTACALAVLLLTVTIVCITAILYNKPADSTSLIAEIYQDGDLCQSIPLNEVTESYTLTFTGTNGGTNTVEVRPGSIGILSADCPDKLCVHQGFIDSSLLPITCLPNRLVIQIKENSIIAPDAAAH